MKKELLLLLCFSQFLLGPWGKIVILHYVGLAHVNGSSRPNGSWTLAHELWVCCCLTFARRLCPNGVVAVEDSPPKLYPVAAQVCCQSTSAISRPTTNWKTTRATSIRSISAMPPVSFRKTDFGWLQIYLFIFAMLGSDISHPDWHVFGHSYNCS